MSERFSQIVQSRVRKRLEIVNGNHIGPVWVNVCNPKHGISGACVVVSGCGRLTQHSYVLLQKTHEEDPTKMDIDPFCHKVMARVAAVQAEQELELKKASARAKELTARFAAAGFDVEFVDIECRIPPDVDVAICDAWDLLAHLEKFPREK